MKIAVDAMGGDYAPATIVEGAVQAARHSSASIILVGDSKAISEELKKHNPPTDTFTIVHASQVVGMNESPAISMRKKRDSSIRVGLNLVVKGEADAFVSAGNTGAVMATAILMLRPMEGIDRPAIAVPLPTLMGPVTLLDAGANVDCKVHQLLQFGLMGQVYAKYILGRQDPRVGLLNNGEEEEKGNEVAKAAYQAFKKTSLNFIGNVEGKQLYKGAADVVVADGFTGNITLKVSESLAAMISSSLKSIFSRNLRSKLAYLLIKPYLESFKKKIDYAEYGGAPLLGINGVCIIAHGSSSPKAAKNAILQAEKFASNRIIDHIKEDLALNPIAAGKGEEGAGIWDKLKKSLSSGEEGKNS